MKKITIDDKNYDLITSFSEMNSNQYLCISGLLGESIFSERKMLELNSERIATFHLLSNIPFRIIREIKAFEWVDILPHLNFIYEAPDLKTNPIPVFKYSIFKEYFGPVGLFETSTIEEIVNADDTFIKAVTTKNVEHIYKLFAILYRPVRKDLKEFKNSEAWNGDIREPYNSSKMKERIDLFKNTKSSFPFAVFYLYYSFRQQKLLYFKNVFSVPKDGKVKHQVNNYGWAGTLMEMAETGVFGDLNNTKNVNWFTFMVALSKKIDAQSQTTNK